MVICNELMARLADRFRRLEPRRAATCLAAGVPDGIGFATKPTLATAVVLAALEVGVPAHW
ncbi:hypothetical protein ACFPOI_14855 [Nonomuraea angiospora]|uniref:SRSO17 transposase n=1 Tax=Nonomuraea angiospora TaxID=46172 RepID=A0ABR9MGE0_9ACTN|nr:hypothetical protein [Nonomuraea angiospora]MBE1591824.1 SRSO17 transposase [Nonomuraea angiospora]